MGAERHNPGSGSATLPWRDLLHLEADGPLTEPEQAQLQALQARHGEALERDRRHLALGVHALRTLSPPLPPTSVAAPVVADLRVRRWLREAPLLPASVAPAVAADIALAGRLTAQAVPDLPTSVAGAVADHVVLGTLLRPPLLPQSAARRIASEVEWAARLGTPLPAPGVSVAPLVAARVARDAPSQLPVALSPTPHPVPPRWSPPAGLAEGAVLTPLFEPRNGRTRHNPAPLILVVSLLLSLTLLGVSSVWPNLAAGALVLRTLLGQVSPVVGAGLALLLLTSALVSWRPAPAAQRLGAGAFALSAALILPGLLTLAGHGRVTFGQDLQVSGTVDGNVITVGGNVYLRPGADVHGEVVTLLGDVHRDANTRVTGRVNALLGHAPGDREALETEPPRGLGAVTATAFRPVLGWLGGAAWPQVFVTLTGGALLLLFVSGLAPVLARRQRHAPVRTLALGVLALAGLLGPAGGLALAGLLGPALIALALAGLLIALGLSVSAYDAGRALAFRVRLPVPDAVGALLGLSAVAATLSEPPLALAVALVGGAWGTGTLLLARQGDRTPARSIDPSRV